MTRPPGLCRAEMVLEPVRQAFRSLGMPLIEVGPGGGAGCRRRCSAEARRLLQPTAGGWSSPLPRAQQLPGGGSLGFFYGVDTWWKQAASGCAQPRTFGARSSGWAGGEEHGHQA